MSVTSPLRDSAPSKVVRCSVAKIVCAVCGQILLHDFKALGRGTLYVRCKRNLGYRRDRKCGTWNTIELNGTSECTVRKGTAEEGDSHHQRWTGRRRRVVRLPGMPMVGENLEAAAGGV